MGRLHFSCIFLACPLFPIPCIFLACPLFPILLLAKAMEETEKEDNLSHEEALKQIDMKKVK
jgi:hypothetical protein